VIACGGGGGWGQCWLRVGQVQLNQGTRAFLSLGEPRSTTPMTLTGLVTSTQLIVLPVLAAGFQDRIFPACILNNRVQQPTQCSRPCTPRHCPHISSIRRCPSGSPAISVRLAGGARRRERAGQCGQALIQCLHLIIARTRRRREQLASCCLAVPLPKVLHEEAITTSMPCEGGREGEGRGGSLGGA
jgi:hypothetical protein